LAAVEDTGRIRINDLESGSWSRIGVSIDEGRLPNIHFHPTENIIATIYHDSSIELWDADTGRLLHTLSVQADFLEMHQFSPDGRMISTVDSENRIYIWDVVSGEQLYEFETVEGLPIWSQFSGDGRLFLAREYYGEGRLWVWRLDE
jgi:WD40 repeat protein